MIRLTLTLATAAVLGLAPSIALAQSKPAPAAPKPAAPAPAGTVIVCPPTLVVSYSKVETLDFGVKNTDGSVLDMTGFAPAFAPVTVRLNVADVTPGADKDNEFTGGMADNADETNPNEPSIYTIVDKETKQPIFEAFITCQYEGGLSIQKPVPKTAKACALRQTLRDPLPSERSTRQVVTKAEFTCN